MSTPTAPTPMNLPERRGAFRMLFFCLVVIGAGNTMVANAVLPPLARTLALPDWTVGAIFSLSALAWSIMSPFWGGLSGRIGRRRVAVIGLTGYAVSMALFGLSGWLALEGFITKWWLVFLCFLFSRTLFGIFGSGTNPAAQAYVADRTSPDERTTEIAALSSGFSFGGMAGPPIAAAIVSWLGLLSPFAFAAGFAAVMAFLVAIRLPEHRPPKTKLYDPKAARGLWRDPAVAPYLIFAVSISLTSGIVLQTFPFALMDKLAVEGREASQFIAIATTMGAMATIFAQLVLIPRLKPSNRVLTIWGAFAFAVGCAMIIPAREIAPLALSQFAIGLGQGMARAGFSSGASLAVSPDRQGAVAGLVVSANGMGFIVSPFFGPFLYENFSTWVPFAIAGVMLLIMSAFAWRFVRDTRYQDPAEPSSDPTDV